MNKIKATGMVRKVDDLGRIVLPKEIRRNLDMEIGDPVEIFVEEDTIILKKYNIVLNPADAAQALRRRITNEPDLYHKQELLKKMDELDALFQKELENYHKR